MSKKKKPEDLSFVRPEKMGAPEKITPNLTADICNTLRLGAYVETASAMAGIERKTFQRWVKKGGIHIRKKKASIYADFCRAVKRAMAEADARDLLVIDEAAQGNEKKEREPNWKAAAWKLERRRPKRYGRREQVKLYEAKESEEFEDEQSSHEKLMGLITEMDSDGKKKA